MTTIRCAITLSSKYINGGLGMKANKWVALLATGSMLAVAVPVVAQFGGLKSLKKAMDTVTKELEQPKHTANQAQQQAETPPIQDNYTAMIARWTDLHGACRGGAGRRNAEGYPLVCNDRDALTETLTQNGWCRGGGDPTWTGDDEWLRCATTPVAKPRDVLKGQWVLIADSCTPEGMISDAVIEIGEGEEGENLYTAYSSCSFPRNGIVGTSDYSGKMSCASEGYEGTPEARLKVTESGLLVVSFSAYVASYDGEDPTEIEASNNTYKRCPKRINNGYD